MFTFPSSISNLVFQYPSKRQTIFATQVLKFVGGGEQRYQIAGSLLRQWEARPSLLPDSAWSDLSAFFAAVGGSTNSFRFTDPWDGSVYPICYFKDDTLTSTLLSHGRNTVLFTIMEGRPQA